MLLGTAFAGYPVLMIFLSRQIKGKGTPKSELTGQAAISMVLIVANEQERIRNRIENLFSFPYPADKVELIVVVDGATDETAKIVTDMAQADARIKLVIVPSRTGKANGLNQGVAAAKGDILVFADARQSFTSETIPLLLAPFTDPAVGAVSGRLIVGSDGSSVGQGVQSYWTLESRLREAEAVLDSCIGCTGAVYALRRNLFRAIPQDTLLDDVLIPMQAAIQGNRIWYVPEALAYDPQALDAAKEMVRKKRTLAGNFQLLFRHPEWLGAKNRLRWQLICHKYLRLGGPLFLVGCLLSSWGLREHDFYTIALWGQILLYLFAVAGLLLPQVKFKLFALPAGFLFLNWMIVAGFTRFITSRGGVWEQVKRV